MVNIQAFISKKIIQSLIHSGYRRILVLFCMMMLSLAVCSQQQIIDIRMEKEGRLFEGLGALSAGASSRLLIDYPEPYKSQILDFLFKPMFGASLQHLKVEIGGDVNSTSGAEPSHARTRDELNHPLATYFNRGYEWWLMKEAKKRNPDLFLDCLEWGTPGWIGEHHFYSGDNIQYIIAFLKGAKVFHQLDMNYTGVWNERMYNAEWIKRLRQSLDSNGLSHVKIVAADLCCNEQWKISGELYRDKELRNSIAVLGDHYPERDKAYNSSDTAKLLNLPLWNSEGGPWKGNWEGFRYLAKMFNRDYIEGRMTKNITWSLITSYFDNLALPNSGMMKANTPWSGHYEVEPALWSFAHTTQFAKPGWHYVDNGCGYFNLGGSYVTLASPMVENQDISIIMETMDATGTQQVIFNLPDHLSTDSVHVWQTKMGKEQFIRRAGIQIRNHQIRVDVEPNSLYSFTTTSGQRKGQFSDVPANKEFPFPYFEDFNHSDTGRAPKYFSDQAGAFETVFLNKKSGNCLKQMVLQPGIEWEGRRSFVQSLIGDTAWKDYSVSTKVLVTADSNSFAAIIGRAVEIYRSHEEPDAYRFIVYHTGKWELWAGKIKIAKGNYKMNQSRWIGLSLAMRGNSIKAYIDNHEIVSKTDGRFSHGMAGIGSSYHGNRFDDFTIQPNTGN